MSFISEFFTSLAKCDTTIPIFSFKLWIPLDIAVPWHSTHETPAWAESFHFSWVGLISWHCAHVYSGSAAFHEEYPANARAQRAAIAIMYAKKIFFILSL